MTAQIDHLDRPAPPLWALLVLLALAALLLVGNAVKVQNGSHAVKKHAADAAAIHRCLDRKGPSDVYRFTSWRRPRHFIQTCQLDDGRWGLRIIQKVRDGWRERTSFVVKDGTRQQLIEYVSARAVRFAGKLSVVE